MYSRDPGGRRRVRSRRGREEVGDLRSLRGGPWARSFRRLGPCPPMGGLSCRRAAASGGGDTRPRVPDNRQDAARDGDPPRLSEGDGEAGEQGRIVGPRTRGGRYGGQPGPLSKRHENHTGVFQSKVLWYGRRVARHRPM